MDEAWITLENCVSGKKRSSTSAPVLSALVIRPGTQVRRIRYLGQGMRSASAMDLVASTVSAVPRMTVESSFTGMTTMPPFAAARYALKARRLSTGEQSMIAMS